VIGFREVSRGLVDGLRSAALGAHDDESGWLEIREKPGIARVPRGGLLGLYHCAVLLPSRGDLGRFFVHAARQGVAIASANHLVSEALYLTDPDGLTVEVYRDLSRDQWEYADGEVRLATLPLDIDSVVADAAEARPWDSLPPGSTMGHLHFYVGDLTNADDFYHQCLGLDRTVSSYPGALFVSAGGYHHHVGLNTWASHARAAGPDDAGLVSWELVVPDREAIDDIGVRLSASGYPTRPITDGIEAVDPWGIVARIVNDRRS
jgi:catechol 2,3-dioxygenase